MKERFILAIDEGTTNVKTGIVNSRGEIVVKSSHPLRLFYPHPGWVEQDPHEVWDAVSKTIEICLTDVPPTNVEAIAISNQRETIMIWDRFTGEPLAPAIVWQCRRTASACEELRISGVQPWVASRTGLVIDAEYPSTKLCWLLDHVPNAAERAERGEICFGSMDSWLLWNLTGGIIHAMDVSNASRTQLFNLESLEWDRELLQLFRIPYAVLPKVLPTGAIFGYTAACGTIPAGLPIASMFGDSHAALFGQGGYNVVGTIKATYGTGTSLMTPIHRPIESRYGLSTTIAWQQDNVVYAFEGNINMTGSVFQWLGEFMGYPDPIKEAVQLANMTPSSEGVYLVPSMVGLAAPHWDDMATGLITGLTRGSSAAHLARAALESIAYQVRDVFDAVQEETSNELVELLADGGASRNDVLMQFQADILGVPVLRSSVPDISLIGAALMAGLVVGLWKSPDDFAHLHDKKDRFLPQMNEVERGSLYDGWKKAVKRVTMRT